jgi:CRP-like cAMP-binding protein
MRTAIRTDAFLANLPLFRGLPAGDIARLAEGTTRRVLKRGETLFEEGQPSIGVHAVVYGRIALVNRTSDGRERVVDVDRVCRGGG